MIAKLFSCALVGLEVYPVEVEIGLQPGLPFLQIVGLPDLIIKESKERIWSAINNSGYKFPNKKVIVNLAPASLKKVGALLDLPISLGILIASNQIAPINIQEYLFVGELALDGSIRSVTGSLSIAMQAQSLGFKKVVVPANNANETALITYLKVYPCDSLSTCVDFLHHPDQTEPFQPKNATYRNPAIDSFDYNQVKGQNFAKRGIEIACAGGHNLLMVGPPGSGKTMLARRIPTILPQMSLDETLESTQIFSIANQLDDKTPIITHRPFRSPHHTASDVSIVGGGSIPKPGEVSLAHHGVLFMDEFTEFRKNVLQVLRQPLEDGQVTITRMERSITYPSRFMLVAAMNPCECGYYGHPDIPCRCHPNQIRRYLSKISGPILDRIDIHIEVPQIKYHEMVSDKKEESSQTILERVALARNIQRERYGPWDFDSNAFMNQDSLEQYCQLNSSVKHILQMAMEKLHLSARGFNKIRKISRTIADLDQRTHIEDHDVMEALQFRGVDRILH